MSGCGDCKQCCMTRCGNSGTVRSWTQRIGQHNKNVMCPTMSLAATIIFSMILGGAPVWQLPAIWAGTLIKNFPMAFFWNMFAAAPFTNWACGKLFE